MSTVSYQDRIAIEPGKRGGKPCIRGMRIAVYDVLDYLASSRSRSLRCFTQRLIAVVEAVEQDR